MIGNVDAMASIGFVLNQYHTELLEFLFELVHTKYNIILYIENKKTYTSNRKWYSN